MESKTKTESDEYRLPGPIYTLRERGSDRLIRPSVLLKITICGHKTDTPTTGGEVEKTKKTNANLPAARFKETYRGTGEVKKTLMHTETGD